VTRSGTTRLHRRAQAQREAGRRGSTHPGVHPSVMGHRREQGSDKHPRPHPNATKPCLAGRGSASGGRTLTPRNPGKQDAAALRELKGKRCMLRTNVADREGHTSTRTHVPAAPGFPSHKIQASNFCGFTKLSQSESRPPDAHHHHSRSNDHTSTRGKIR